MQGVDGRPGLGVWVWTPSWSCRQKTSESASREIAGRRESGRVAALGVWSGTPRCALLTAETHPGTVPTGRAAVGITCRDGDPAETLLWPCHGQDSPDASSPPRGRAPKTSAVKARNRAPRLRTLRPSCQPPPPHGQRSGAAQPQCRGRRRGRASGMPGEPWQTRRGSPGSPDPRRHVRPETRVACASGFQAPADVTSAGPGRALRACARPRGRPACLAGIWGQVASALCAEVAPATSSPGP